MKSAFALTAVICLTGNVQAVKIQGTGTNAGGSPDPCEAVCKPVENECKSQKDADKAVCKDCAKCNRDQGPGPTDDGSTTDGTTAGGPPATGQCLKGETMMNQQYNNADGSPDCQCVTLPNACEKNLGPKGPHCIFDNFCDGGSPDPCETECKPVENECKSFADAQKPVCASCAKCNREKGPPPSAHPCDAVCNGTGMNEQECNACNGNPGQGPPKPTAEQIKKVKEVTDWCKATAHCSKAVHREWKRNVPVAQRVGGSATAQRWCETGPTCRDAVSRMYAAEHHPNHPHDQASHPSGSAAEHQQASDRSGPTAEQIKAQQKMVEKIKAVTDWCKATANCANQVKREWEKNVPKDARKGAKATAERWCGETEACRKQVIAGWAKAHPHASHQGSLVQTAPTAAEAEKVKAVTAWCKATEHCSKAVHAAWTQNVPATQRLGDSATAEKWCVTGPTCRKNVMALYADAHQSATH